ncbi:asparagine synthase-related protein [Lamprobacter modestohalophilus]|uniref:asparagine synthase-related protein n=1 Tax=Lamprobacter modestohalophilus TaxID=1064514 RepID=UPI002ADECDBC|nr:asparagine synthase-related protein [Lamprobacter modestohalophilus]MEA1050964.1 asparagine synthase-related protein [Lamprobacter modestohalophilus]
MAVILGIHDSNLDRRRVVRDRLPNSLSGILHLNLQRQEQSFHHIDLFWEASTSTPISSATDQLGSQKRLAWVVGDYDAHYALPSDAAQRLLKNTDRSIEDISAISGQNGYYMAILSNDASRIVLGTDVLGFFPLYYWSHNDIFLFGTSPELFRLHPSFPAKPSVYAIASILMFSHISGGQGIYEGVHRNAPGHLVKWTSETGAIEQEANPLRISQAGFCLAYPDTRTRVAECLKSFFKPLSNLSKVNVFLSGGQDSRLIAGLAAKHLLRDRVQAVSLGRGSDMELQYARKVSRLLGWLHTYHDIEENNFLQFATSQLRLESLQGPFVNFGYGTAQSLLGINNAPFLSGYVGDPILGDRQIFAAFSTSTGLFDFNNCISSMNRYGFAIDDVSDLLVFDDSLSVISDVLEALRTEWYAVDALPFQNTWLFKMTNRVRYHVGSIIWRLSLGAWPLLPYLDRHLLDTIAVMPLNYFTDRRIQSDIVKRDFPQLACLPLDCNSRVPGYLVKPLHRKIIDALPSVSVYSWRLHQWLEYYSSQKETRYYYRIYNFNGEGWCKLRQHADRYRRLNIDLLNPNAVDRLLPTADSTPDLSDGIIDSSKLKSLVGLMLWSRLNKSTLTK